VQRLSVIVLNTESEKMEQSSILAGTCASEDIPSLMERIASADRLAWRAVHEMRPRAVLPERDEFSVLCPSAMSSACCARDLPPITGPFLTSGPARWIGSLTSV
jgi:hypothetical protein